MLIQYEPHSFRADSLEVIDQAVGIVDEYHAQGFNLTLRQLFYQFVSRDLLANTQRSYKRLGDIISKARLAGLLSWQAIEDRLRKPESKPHWDSPADILEAAAASYNRDTRETQPNRIEVWVEKDALSDVVARIGRELDVTWFACRGYVSQSAMWRAARRFEADGRPGIILHLGDHDPSGIDMTRDISDRICCTFGQQTVLVRRIALTIDQVEQYDPPPNPAKLTDTRASSYIEEYGDQSWELDALPPNVLAELIEREVDLYTDWDDLEDAKDRQRDERQQLHDLVDQLRGGA
jgi:hypothetical protein